MSCCNITVTECMEISLIWTFVCLLFDTYRTVCLFLWKLVWMGDSPWPNNHSTYMNFIYFEGSVILLICSYILHFSQ